MQSSVGLSEMGTRYCSAVAEMQNLGVLWFACCHISSGITRSVCAQPKCKSSWAVVSCQWVSCLPAQLLPIGVQEQLGTALEALGCGEKLHSNVMCCLQLIHPAISVTAH